MGCSGRLGRGRRERAPGALPRPGLDEPLISQANILNLWTNNKTKITGNWIGWRRHASDGSMVKYPLTLQCAFPNLYRGRILHQSSSSGLISYRMKLKNFNLNLNNFRAVLVQYFLMSAKKTRKGFKGFLINQKKIGAGGNYMISCTEFFIQFFAAEPPPWKWRQMWTVGRKFRKLEAAQNSCLVHYGAKFSNFLEPVLAFSALAVAFCRVSPLEFCSSAVMPSSPIWPIFLRHFPTFGAICQIDKYSHIIRLFLGGETWAPSSLRVSFQIFLRGEPLETWSTHFWYPFPRGTRTEKKMF